jgi:hypothetical protein
MPNAGRLVSAVIATAAGGCLAVGAAGVASAAPGAEFVRGGTSWSVYMDANGKGSYALCVGPCDATDRTKTTSITLR